jgi:hypothetical protein
MIAGKPLLCVNSYDLFSVSRIYYKNLHMWLHYARLEGQNFEAKLPRDFSFKNWQVPAGWGPPVISWFKNAMNTIVI